MHFLEDGKTFIWTSERNGFANLYLYDLTGKLHAALTSHRFEAGPVLKVDEKAGVVYYRARDGENHMKWQLHRVGLDGKGDRRLTDPAFSHTDTVSPDGKYFVDVAQTHDTPPVTRLMDRDGKPVAELAASDTSKIQQLGLKPVELCKFKAADGQTDLYGLLHFPSNFDPAKKYPLLVTVYAGPATNGANENFATPNPLTEYGFLVAALDSRRRLSQVWRGRNRRSGGRREIAVEPSIRRQESRGHLRHFLRRLRIGHGLTALSRRVCRGVGKFAGHRLAQLRHHLHRTLYVDAAGE
jgi:dipeptidyl-peptidase-4